MGGHGVTMRTKVYVARQLITSPSEPIPDWRTRSLAVIGEKGFAQVMLRASQGDPFETSTEASALEDFRDLVLSAGSAFDAERWMSVSDDRGDIGVVLPQLLPEDPSIGILAYLAVMPERRGSGLGGKLHRYGLMRLSDLGATEYRGSTDAGNAPMRSIFAANGCTER